MAGTIALICSAIAIIAIYIALRMFFGRSIFSALADVFSFFTSWTENQTVTISKKQDEKFKRMSNAAKKKSWAYKYKKLINDILLDMGWRQIGVTIEGLTTVCIIFTVLVSLVTGVVLKNILVALVMFIVVFLCIITVLFSISRNSHRKRKAILIASEDLLCSAMADGVYKAIKNNIHQLDPEVRPDFQCFLDDIDDYKISLDTAIDRLNDRLGSKFDNFCEKAKVMANNYQPGYEDSFLFNIEDNAIESELDYDVAQFAFNINMDYFATLGLLGVFFAVTLGMYDKMADFYFHGAGRFLIVLYIVVAIGVYIFTQVVQSKRF